MNGRLWQIRIVNASDPLLIDRTNRLTLATCDPSTNTVYMSSALYGDMFIKVLIHELGHCLIFSYNLDEEIHRVVDKKHWIEAEEWVCNFIYDYGLKIFQAAKRILCGQAINIIPEALEKLIA